MSAKAWGTTIVLVAGATLCLGLWLRGTVAKGTAYRVVSGTNTLDAYRFTVREHVALWWALHHPLAARQVRGEAYAAVSGVISCLAATPTRASVAPAEAQIARRAQLPVMLQVLLVRPLGRAESNSTDASMVRSDCVALMRLDPVDLQVPQVPGA